MSPVSSASSATARSAALLRWLGLTLVVLLLLQLLALLSSWNWSDPGFQQLLVDRLVSQSPMALVGLLLMLGAERLDRVGPDRTPLRWLVVVAAAVLAVAMVAMVPVSISGDQVLSRQADQALSGMEAKMAMARIQGQSEEVVDQVAQQLEQAGQLPSTATDGERQGAARRVIDGQIKQLEGQLQQGRRARDLALQQRRFGGTGSALVLAIAFALVALAALV